MKFIKNDNDDAALTKIGSRFDSSTSSSHQIVTAIDFPSVQFFIGFHANAMQLKNCVKRVKERKCYFLKNNFILKSFSKI